MRREYTTNALPTNQLELFSLPKGENWSDVVIIDLWPITCNCALCGVLCVEEYDLPMFEGKIVSEDHPEWGGQGVCKSCFEKHGWKSQVNWYER